MPICKIRLFVRREEEKRKLAARNRRAQDTEDSDSGWLCPTFCGDNKFSMIPNIKRWNLAFVDRPGAAGFDREQDLAATKIQSRIRGKHARPCKEDLFFYLFFFYFFIIFRSQHYHQEDHHHFYRSNGHV